MTRSIDDLERELLRRPFDRELRSDYARALTAAGRLDEALAQWQLLREADGGDPALRVDEARCLLALGREAEARARLAEARTLPGFELPPDLGRMLGAEPGAAPALRLVHDVGEVVQLVRPKDSIRFDDVAGMHELKKVLRLQIIEPFLKPGLFQRFRKRAGGGVLLYGPPGCGKTMIARAVATECRASFVSVGISEVLSLWRGESERNLAALFEKARSEAPCVLFFDELDALAYSRSKSSSDSSRTVVNEFLAQLDGFEQNNASVLILAATNMPWDVDAAMKRPGRFSRQVFVPPPDTEARLEMLRMKLADVPCDALDLPGLAQRARRFSGADLDGLIDLAKEAALSDIIANDQAERRIGQRDLEEALERMSPSAADWLQTARNLVRFGGRDTGYKDVETYLRQEKLF